VLPERIEGRSMRTTPARENLTLLQARPLATRGVILRYAAKPRDA
jgi:hypothetical protein